MTKNAKRAARGANKETAPGANRGGGTKNEADYGKNRNTGSTAAPVVNVGPAAVGLVLTALANLLCDETDLVLDYVVPDLLPGMRDDGPRVSADEGVTTCLVAVKPNPVPVESNVVLPHSPYRTGTHPMWNGVELERRVVEEIARMLTAESKAKRAAAARHSMLVGSKRTRMFGLRGMVR